MKIIGVKNHNCKIRTCDCKDCKIKYESNKGCNICIENGENIKPFDKGNCQIYYKLNKEVNKQ